MKFNLIEINNIEEFEYDGYVYDLEIEDDHSYNIENVIVHNSACTTRIQTGCGVPQVTAIQNAVYYMDYVSDNYTPIIADGGIKYPGDVMKALACGASSVMIGSVISGTEETPGAIKFKNNEKFKVYRGMASFDAANNRQSTEKGYSLNTENYVAEGVDAIIPYRGAVTDIIQQFAGGLRSGMSYLGANSVEEIKENADIIKLSNASWQESKPHIIRN